MDAQLDTHRFSNQTLKNVISRTGYKLYINPETRSQIERFQGHDRVQIDKTIQYLAAVPRPRSAGEPVLLRGHDHYRVRNSCCMIDYIVSPGAVTVTRVAYEKVQPKSGTIVTVKGTLADLPKDVRAMLKNSRFWSIVNRAESRMKHFRVTGERLNQTTGVAIYFSNNTYRFDDVSESAIKGFRYGSNAILGGDFAGNSQVPITGAVAVVVSHPKWEGPDDISKREQYWLTAGITRSLVLVGSRERNDNEYVIFHEFLKEPIIIRDERDFGHDAFN